MRNCKQLEREGETKQEHLRHARPCAWRRAELPPCRPRAEAASCCHQPTSPCPGGASSQPPGLCFGRVEAEAHALCGLCGGQAYNNSLLVWAPTFGKNIRWVRNEMGLGWETRSEKPRIPPTGEAFFGLFGLRQMSPGMSVGMPGSLRLSQLSLRVSVGPHSRHRA